MLVCWNCNLISLSFPQHPKNQETEVQTTVPRHYVLMCKFLPPHLHPLAHLHPPYLFICSYSFVSWLDSLLFHVKAPSLFEPKLILMSRFIVLLKVKLRAAFGRYNKKITFNHNNHIVAQFSQLSFKAITHLQFNSEEGTLINTSC